MAKKATMNHSTRKPKKAMFKHDKLVALTRQMSYTEKLASQYAAEAKMWKGNFAALAGVFTGVIVAFLAGYIPCV